MKPLSLNLSKVKKIAGDHKSTTFMHPDGHKITVAHAPLSALQIKQMQKMPIHKMAYGGAEPIDPNQPENQVQPGQDSSAAAFDSAPPAADRAPAEESPTPGQSMQSAFEEEKAANLSGALAIGQEGSAEASAYNNASNAISKLPTQNDVVNSYRDKNDQLFKSYQEQKLDPERYWQNHSKVAAGIGMILGGAAAGGGGVNQALGVVQNGIAKDIDAQKNAQDQKMNLWKMNRQALGDDLSANLATQNQLLTGVKYQIDKAASQAKGPLALANAQAANARIDQAISLNNVKLGLHAGLSQMAGDGSEQSFVGNLNSAAQFAPEIAKDAQAKYLPGVGVAKIPLTPEDRSSFTSLDNLEKQIDRGINFAKSNGTTLPGTVKNQEANDIQNGIQLEIGNLVGLKRINEFEAKKYTDLAGSPGAFRTAAAIQSLTDLKKDIGIKRQAMQSSLSISPFKKANPDQVALQWARSHPQDPRAAKIIQSIAPK